MKRKKSLLDEGQEQQLLRIERNGVSIAFWGLFIALLFQSITSIGDPTGETIVFLCLACYLAFASVKSGLWDRRWKPSPKINLIASSIAGLGIGILYFFVSYIRYDKFYGSIATGIFMFISVFIVSLLALTIMSNIYKKRVEQLENQAEDEE